MSRKYSNICRLSWCGPAVWIPRGCIPTLYVVVLEQVVESLRLSDAHVKRDSDGDLSESLEDKVTDKGRRRKQSPTKRRKIEHESSLLFEVLVVWCTESRCFLTYTCSCQEFKLVSSNSELYLRSRCPVKQCGEELW